MKRILRAAWNPRSSVPINYSAAIDLQHLQQLLETSTKLMWHSSISILIPSFPQFFGQSDACNIAMGGLLFPLLIQWRISNSAFRCLPEWQAASPDEPAFHINIHEFIALVINTYLKQVQFFQNWCK